MPGSPGPSWTLEGFEEALDAWAEREQPTDDLRIVVTAWVLSRFEDPFEGVHREPGFANLWFGAIPQTRHGDSGVVVCAYWVDAIQRRVRCDSIASLSWPA